MRKSAIRLIEAERGSTPCELHHWKNPARRELYESHVDSRRLLATRAAARSERPVCVPAFLIMATQSGAGHSAEDAGPAISAALSSPGEGAGSSGTPLAGRSGRGTNSSSVLSRCYLHPPPPTPDPPESSAVRGEWGRSAGRHSPGTPSMGRGRRLSSRLLGPGPWSSTSGGEHWVRMRTDPPPKGRSPAPSGPWPSGGGSTPREGTRPQDRKSAMRLSWPGIWDAIGKKPSRLHVHSCAARAFNRVEWVPPCLFI